MEFIDTTGHVFSIESYSDNPIDIKYKEGDYVFWIKDEEISINNYYIKAIRFIIPTSEIQEVFDDVDYTLGDPFTLNISIDSQFYKLLSVKSIQEKLEYNNDLKQKIEIYYDEAKSELSLEDFYWEDKENRLIVYANDKEYYLFPFYVIAKSRITGTFLSNILINYKKAKKAQEQKKVKLNKEKAYDYLLSQLMNNIKIYEWNPETEEKTFYWAIPNGYDPDYNEIIVRDQEEMRYRIRNWGGGLLNPDVYHYIYRFPRQKFLKKDHYYVFEGKTFNSCHYCGSRIYYNHDGYAPYSALEKGPLLKLDGTPYYEDDFDYDESTNTYTPKPAEELSLYGMLNDITSDHEYGQGFEFINEPFKCPTNIRDIWFDIDNSEVTNNKDGITITTNEYKYEYTYTQITIGGSFIDECEELLINGRNMGIQLPKDIIKAIYQSPFYNKYPDEVLFKDKIKELLMNYMSIKGECGNFKSAVNSLKWFGWEDKVQISQLIKTDNEFQDQYIIDYFNITNDLKDTYKYFNPTNLITLSIKENDLTGEIDQQNYNNLFWGEGQPLVEDLFDKVVEVYHDDLIFYKPYYDFIFIELAIKLDCLRYYYQKYFLPLHLRILRSSLEHKVYANDIKMNSFAFEKITTSPIYIPDNNIRVEFPETHELLFYKSSHLIDDRFNEFSDYSNEYSGEDLYYINENCIKIPIKFINDNKRYSKNPIGEYILINGKYFKIVQFLLEDPDKGLYIQTTKEKATHYRMSKNTDILELDPEYRYSKISTEYFNCDIILTVTTKIQNDKGHYIFIDGKWRYKEKFYDRSFIEDPNGNYINLYGEYQFVNPKDRYDMVTKVLIERNSFNFNQTIDKYYINLVFIPRLIRIYDIDWLNSSYRVSVLCNNKWFIYDFTIKLPNLYLDFGKLSYRYYLKEGLTNFKQIKDIRDNHIYFNSFIYQPDLITIDTLFKEEDTNRVLSFIDKIQETRLSRDDVNMVDVVDENKMYEFVRKYYRNQIVVPYNKKYFNRIHLFDIYKGYIENKYSGFKYIIKIEGWGEDAYWENEWSPNNGGKNNVIKGFIVYWEDLINEHHNAFIIAYREKNNVTIRIDESNINTDIPYNDDIDGIIEYIEVYINENKLLETLYSYEGYVFDYLYTVDDDEEIDHTNIYGPWWYTKEEKLEYDNNPINIELYSQFFPQEKDYDFAVDLKEKVPYDVYLMHDKYDSTGKNKSYWYIVMISKYPIGDYKDDSLLDIDLNTEYTVSNYFIKYSGFSMDKFLVNRMDIQKANGYNHFNTEDLMIVSINNNDYQFNIDLTNKWIIEQIYDPLNNSTVNSNANIMIIPTNNFDQKYSPGYYNITLKYIIDGINIEERECKAYYRINKEYEEVNYEKYSYEDFFDEPDYFIKIREDIDDTTNDGNELEDTDDTGD